MTRLVAPIAAHEGIARGALVVALVVGGMLALTTDVGPPDYLLPAPRAAMGEVAALTGIDTDGGGGGRSLTSWDTTDLVTGDEFRVEVAWSDVPLSTPTHHTVAAERQHECIRLAVSTTGLTLDPAGLDAFLDRRTTDLDAYLATLPADPCAGRPRAP